jgi:PAS domain S-box-containing protein
MEVKAAQTPTHNNQLFHDVFNTSPIGIAVENLEGQPLFVNPSFCSFLGFSEEELRNKHCVDFSPREDAEKDWALFQQLRAGSIDHYQLEKRYFRRDGSLVWGSLSISLLKGSPSRLVLAMVQDITDKKKAEEARYRYAAVIESSDDAIASGTLDGIIVSWNTGAQKIYGYTEAEAVGKPISMLVPPELPDEENKILETLKSGDRIEHFETVRVTKTGKRINVSLTISPIKDSTGKTVGISGIARDITERKLAEEALRASEERLRLAQQIARIGSFEWNIQTGVNTWTPELEAIYGLPPGGFGGTQTAFENLVHPDDRAGVIKLVDAAMKSGQPTKGEWRVVWGDGRVHWIAGRWQGFMDASGEPSKMIGVNIDITERKLAEEEVLEVSRKLIEAQEQERTRIGRELHDDIGQRLAMLVIELQQFQEHPADLSEVRRRMGEVKKRTSDIADDIQSLSHELHSAKLQYLGIAGAMRGFCREFGEQQKVEIDFQTHDVPGPLSADISLCFFRVLQEALHNSAKHSGVRHFEVRLWGTSDEIDLTVKDSGVGFDREAAKTSRGLGLISMEERLKLLNGTLSIESQPNRGTTIHARVPLSSGSDSMRAAG